MTQTALVVGATGQDGYFLVQELVKSDLKVLGIGRDLDPKNLVTSTQSTYFSHDLTGAFDLENFLYEKRPDIIYYVAAFHGPSGTTYGDNFEESFKVNVIRPSECLKYCKDFPNTKFIFFNSSKVYDTSLCNVISEKTMRNPKCIYGLQKELVFTLMVNYRDRYGLKAYNFWFFNHESKRRKLTYFLPKLVDIAANSYMDRDYIGKVGNLDFVCDWGDAEQYMKAVVQLSLKTDADDYIVATGQSLTGQMLAEKLFLSLGLDWKLHINTLESCSDKPPNFWQADNSKLLSNIPGLKMNSAVDICKKILTDNYGIKV